MKTTKKAISLALAVLLITAALSGCGAPAEPTPDFVYVPSYATLPKEVTSVNYVAYLDGVFYFTMPKPYDKEGNPLTDEQLRELQDEYNKANQEQSSEQTTASYTPRDPGYIFRSEMYTINEDGTNLKKLEGYMPIQTASAQSNLSGFNVDASGKMWALESVSRPADDGRQTFFLRRLGADGSEEFNIVLNDAFGQASEFFNISDFLCDSAGNVYLSAGLDGILVLDPTGQKLFSVPVDGWLNAFVSMTDGTVGAVCSSHDNDASSLRIIDLGKRGWGAEYAAPTDLRQVFAGGGEYDFCYNSSFSFMGYKTSTQQSEEILNWMGSDINGDAVVYAVLKENGDVLAVSSGRDDVKQESFTELITMKKTPYSQVKHKTELTLATMWLDSNTRSTIVNFNKTNQDYRIIIKDYSQYNTKTDYTAGLTKLNTEIISGNIPDMLDVSQLPYEQYAEKGLIADLYPLMEGDSEAGRDKFIPSILKTLESSEGKLYMLAPTFNVTSLMGKSAVVGEEMGWTMEELQAFLAAHPEADYPFGMFISREEILMFICQMNMGNYMNWETGECSFNSDEFKELLTLAKSFPEKVEFSEDTYISAAELIADGRQLLEFCSTGDIHDIQSFEAEFGGEITFKGIPTADRAGNLAVFSGALAVTSSCKDKAGAWAFMRTLYLPEYQNKVYGYPVIQSSFDKKLADAMDPKKNQGSVYEYGPKITPLTQREADEMAALMGSIKHSAVNNDSLMNIIKEEAASFFSGAKDLNHVADVIQSRMTIYINEHR